MYACTLRIAETRYRVLEPYLDKNDIVHFRSHMYVTKICYFKKVIFQCGTNNCVCMALINAPIVLFLHTWF